MSSTLSLKAISVKESQIRQEQDPLGIEVLITYLVSQSGNTLHKICGAKTLSGEYCAADAGAGTNHIGNGHCLEHQEAFVPRLADTINMEGLSLRVIDTFKNKESIDARLLQTIDPEIQGLYSMLEFALQRIPENETPSAKASSDLKGILKDIISAKKDRRVLQDKATLDMSAVQDFINSVMKVITLNVPETLARRILHEILNTVVKPMRAEGRITGETNTP